MPNDKESIPSRKIHLDMELAVFNVPPCGDVLVLAKACTCWPKSRSEDDGHNPRAISDALKEVKIRHIGNCLKADSAYDEGVDKAIGISLDEVPKK